MIQYNTIITICYTIYWNMGRHISHDHFLHVSTHNINNGCYLRYFCAFKQPQKPTIYIGCMSYIPVHWPCIIPAIQINAL